MVPSPLECPGDLEGHEAQQSLRDLGGLFLTRLVALVDHLVLFVLSVQFQGILSLPSLLTNLFLLDFQVSLDFQGSQFGQAVRALRELPGCQEGREDQEARECCCGSLRESG